MRASAVTLVLLAASVGGAGEPRSGLQPGDEVAAWNPRHVAGPDKGTDACPVCTYLHRPVILIFTRDGPNAGALAEKLEKLVSANERRELKGFAIVIDGAPAALARIAADRHITKSGLCYPDPSSKSKDLGELYRIHPDAQNTIIVYKDYRVMATFVNLDAKDFGRVENAVRRMLR